MTDNKKLIPVVRKLVPKMIAADIVGVQPMTGSTGEIFKLRKDVWTDWKTTFAFLPKRSIYGKLIWGRVYRREVLNAWRKVELLKDHPDYKEQWLNKKELFRWKLLNGS